MLKNKSFILLACFMLIGSLSAINTIYLGGISLGKGFDVHIYRTTEPYIYSKTIGETTYSKVVGGTYYYLPGSKSPGHIIIDGTRSWKDQAGILAHEMCHARQHFEGRAQDEAECENVWGRK